MHDRKKSGGGGGRRGNMYQYIQRAFTFRCSGHDTAVNEMTCGVSTETSRMCRYRSRIGMWDQDFFQPLWPTLTRVDLAVGIISHCKYRQTVADMIWPIRNQCIGRNWEVMGGISIFSGTNYDRPMFIC